MNAWAVHGVELPFGDETASPSSSPPGRACHFRHLPVCGDSGLAGIIDITDICRALLALAGAQRKERKRS